MDFPKQQLGGLVVTPVASYSRSQEKKQKGRDNRVLQILQLLKSKLYTYWVHIIKCFWLAIKYQVIAAINSRLARSCKLQESVLPSIFSSAFFLLILWNSAVWDCIPNMMKRKRGYLHLGTA